jgi:hypothetical protein
LQASIAKKERQPAKLIRYAATQQLSFLPSMTITSTMAVNVIRYAALITSTVQYIARDACMITRIIN